MRDAGECGGEENQEGKVDGEGVVLLIGGEREEEEDEGGEEGKDLDGLEGEAGGMLGGGGAGEEAIAVAPCEDEGGGCEEAPGEEPDEVEGPVEVAGELVVVAGDAAAEEAEDVLVDEVEPEEAVAVGTAGVAEAGEDVPGGGDGEEEEGSGEGAETAPLVELAGPEKEGKGGAEDEDEGDEALGEHGEGEGDPEEVGPECGGGCGGCGGRGGRGGRFEGAKQGVEAEGEEEREEGVGDEDAGKEEDADGGEGEDAGVEGRVGAEAGGRKGAAGPGVAEEGEAEDGECEGEVDGEGGGAGVAVACGADGSEEAQADGGDPVGEGRFFEVADAVDVEGDPVAGGEHGLGGLSVGGVGVVEQGRIVEGGDEDDEPEAEKDEEMIQPPGRCCRGCGMVLRCAFVLWGFDGGSHGVRSGALVADGLRRANRSSGCDPQSRIANVEGLHIHRSRLAGMYCANEGQIVM